MAHCVVTFAGGSRGLGKALLETYKQYSYLPVAFHRMEDIPDTLNYRLDIDQLSTLDNAFQSLLDYLTDSTLSSATIHFLSGGSQNREDIDDEERTKQTLLHNYIIPTQMTDKIFKFKQSKFPHISIKLVYYSSAASKHLSGYPHYASAKAALETYFKAKFSQSNGTIKMFLFRLGMVDINHKYFHQLSVNNPESFNDFLVSNVPSGYFVKPSDIAQIVAHHTIDSPASNGLFCDLSGGNSWR